MEECDHSEPASGLCGLCATESRESIAQSPMHSDSISVSSVQHFEVCRHRHSSMTRSELTRPLFMTKGLRFRVRKERIAPLPSSQAACASTRATHAAGTNVRFDSPRKGSGARA